jgi:hypothetical protein
MALREGIKQEFAGCLKPLRLNKDTIPKTIYPLVDWSRIFDKHTPDSAVNPTFKVQLEYLQCDYGIDSLMRIPTTGYPNFDDVVDTEIDRQVKAADFKRRYNALNGYAVELSIHTIWTPDEQEWEHPKSVEYLYNLGQYGYLNLFSPYLLRDAEIMYGDADFKIGVALREGELGGADYIEINGGYSGVVTYFEYEASINASEDFNVIEVGTTTTNIASNRSGRRYFWMQNLGDTDLYFIIGFSSSKLVPGGGFCLKPNETFSVEGKKISIPSRQYYLLPDPASIVLRHPIYAVRKSGKGNVAYQEFY